MNGKRSIARTIILIVILIGSIAFFQYKLTAFGVWLDAPPSMAYVPESEKIRPLFLGFHTAYANFLWIKTTIYFGSHLMGDHEYPWLLQMVDIVTRLNPRFYPAYEFGGLILPDVCKNPEAGKIILERGVCMSTPNKWKLYFYLGMLYYKYYHDYEKAAFNIAVAIQMPGAPVDKLRGLALALFKQSTAISTMEAFLVFLYKTSENPEVKRYLMEQMKITSGLQR